MDSNSAKIPAPIGCNEKAALALGINRRRPALSDALVILIACCNPNNENIRLY
jgi:hypothetical protein